eukprot:TRINITY_DN4104_c0_g1_i1.p1 TRINITY_DN4104_c0_g1~~TRINITY_DN4104_c0_g1_i1.p1  ORF type:complete len:353 (-),score=94.65 TRINITY_DN4104_c0_g1_i1:485-1543(-)
MSKAKKNPKLPDDIEFRRTHVLVGNDAPSHTATYEDPAIYESLGYDNSWNRDEFEKNLKINILKMTKDECQFEIIGIDAAIANAIRRVLIAEVPTMAIENVYIANNTGVIMDEILAHRLGLIPIRADPSFFEFKTKEEDYSDKNCIIFELKVDCKRNPKAAEDSKEPFLNEKVRSANLAWVPQGIQEDIFRDNPIRPVFEDILITKMRPGQAIELNAYCEKGIGKTHAKWSPVSTAFYRLLPEITFMKPVVGNDAEELVKICPMNVFDIEDIGGEKVAKVARPRNCTMCRECIRPVKYQDKIRLSRVKNHFIFSVESTGAYDAGVLFEEAIKVLIEKIEALEKELSTSVLNV